MHATTMRQHYATTALASTPMPVATAVELRLPDAPIPMPATTMQQQDAMTAHASTPMPVATAAAAQLPVVPM